MIDPDKKQKALERLRELKKIADDGGEEAAHADADYVLLDLIDDADIAAAFESIRKWYS